VKSPSDLPNKFHKNLSASSNVTGEGGIACGIHHPARQFFPFGNQPKWQGLLDSSKGNTVCLI